MTRRDSSAIEGDLVVTPVAGHYAIGRVTADGRTQAFIEVQSDCAAAIISACELAGDEHRVFLAQGMRHGSELIDCTALRPRAKR
jgi:hypothetical protein